MSKNTKTMIILAAALSLATCEGPSKSGVKASAKREKCSVNSPYGKVALIQASRNDCGAVNPKTGERHSLAGNGAVENPNEQIFVPAGKCAEINKHVQAGQLEKLDAKIGSKLDLELAKQHVKQDPVY